MGCAVITIRLHIDDKNTWVAVRFLPFLHRLRRSSKYRSLPPTTRSLPLALERTNYVCDRQAFHSALFTNNVIRVRSILSAKLIKHPVLGSTVPTFHSIRHRSFYLQADILCPIILSTFTIPSGVFRMPSSGITKASVEKALASVDKADPDSLLSIVQQLEKLITADREKGRVVPCSSLQKREVFEVFSFNNQYVDFGRFREYDIPEIKLNLSQPFPGLKPSALELLRSICTLWPQSNESNVRIFVSILIHFSIEQINSEIELNASSEASFSSDRLNVPSPSPSPHVAPVTPPRKYNHPSSHHSQSH